VPAQQIEVGKFYLDTNPGGEPILFQCVEAATVTGEKSIMALVFSPSDSPPVSLTEVGAYDTLIEMPEVHLRIDPPSVTGTGMTTSLKMNTLIIADRQAIIAVGRRYGSWSAIDITTGRNIERALQREWVSFRGGR
jgi:hypothetical protein